MHTRAEIKIEGKIERQKGQLGTRTGATRLALEQLKDRGKPSRPDENPASSSPKHSVEIQIEKGHARAGTRTWRKSKLACNRLTLEDEFLSD
jgi:hypothetical protein